MSCLFTHPASLSWGGAPLKDRRVLRHGRTGMNVRKYTASGLSTPKVQLFFKQKKKIKEKYTY